MPSAPLFGSDDFSRTELRGGDSNITLEIASWSRFGTHGARHCTRTREARSEMAPRYAAGFCAALVAFLRACACGDTARLLRRSDYCGATILHSRTNP